jgi:8-oxo-dGTP diphosphatase
MTSSSHIKFAALATDVVCFRVIDKVLHVLLGKVVSTHRDQGMWAHIGGLIRPTETADESVVRLLKDKAGVDHVYTEQLYTFSAVDRDPRGRVVSVGYLALANEDPSSPDNASTEITWCPINKVPKLGYDHNEILQVAIDRLCAKLEYTNIAQHLLPKEFTLSDLQHVYEVVLGSKIDKRNFRKKILATGLIQDTGNVAKRGVMRPAALYTFTSQKQKVVQIL